MQIDLRTVSITRCGDLQPHCRAPGRRQAGLALHRGHDECSLDANFHYRPTWDPEHELFDPRRTRLVMKDWYALKDPRQFYYGAYTWVRARKKWPRPISSLSKPVAWPTALTTPHAAWHSIFTCRCATSPGART